MTKLIDSHDIQNISDISSNIAANLIEPFVGTCQDINIKPLLGKELFDEILSQFDGNILNDGNKALLPYIKKALCWYAYAKYALHGNYQSTSTGFKKKLADESENPSGNEISILYKDIFQTAEHYAGEMTDYLKKNRDTYPLYDKSCTVEAETGGNWA